MPARAFFDTNVLIYSVAENDPRSDAAEALLAAGGVISAHVLNEFVAVARRKLGMSWTEVTEALDAIRTLCPSPVPITVETHNAALRIAQQYGYHIYDALVAAAALEASCDTLYTEDMQDGQLIDARLTVQNRFVHSVPHGGESGDNPFQRGYACVREPRRRPLRQSAVGPSLDRCRRFRPNGQTHDPGSGLVVL